MFGNNLLYNFEVVLSIYFFSLAEDGEETLPTTMTPVNIADFDSYLTPFVGDKATLALLLDYDGTLSPIASHPDLAILPNETKKVLERLANRYVKSRSVTLRPTFTVQTAYYIY